MVGRMDNVTTTVQVTRSSGASSMEKEVREVAPVQAVSDETKKSAESSERMMPTEKAIELVDNMNSFLASADSQLKFVFHNELNEYYVTIVDSKTDEVIREIPSKKLMDIHAGMLDLMGLLVDRKI